MKGNQMKMREALKPWIAFGEWLLENAGKDRLGEAIRENGPIIRQRLEELRDALAAPPRNCERFDNWDDAEAEYQRLVEEGKVEDGTWCEWLWDFAKEGGTR